MTGEASRRNLTRRRREQIQGMRVRCLLSLPLDWSLTERMRGEETWYVSLGDRDVNLASITIHRIPLCSGEDLAYETETGDYISGFAVDVITDGDMPNPAVLRRLGGYEPAFGDSMIIVENPDVAAEFTGLGVESLMMGVGINHVSRESDILAIAEPVPNEQGLKAAAARAARAVNTPTLQANAFRLFKLGVWIKPFPYVHDPSYEQLLDRFGIVGRWD